MLGAISLYNAVNTEALHVAIEDLCPFTIHEQTLTDR